MTRSLLVTVQMQLDETEVPALAARIEPLLQAALAIEGKRVSVSVQDWDDEDEDA